MVLDFHFHVATFRIHLLQFHFLHFPFDFEFGDMLIGFAGEGALTRSQAMFFIAFYWTRNLHISSYFSEDTSSRPNLSTTVMQLFTSVCIPGLARSD